MKLIRLICICCVAYGVSMAQEAPKTTGKQASSGTAKTQVTINAERVPQEKLKEAALSPEEKAIKLLNTSSVPADFPRYTSNLSKEDYEKKVSDWFKQNPDKRKRKD